MPQEEFIIAIYLLIDELYQKIVTTKLRSRGFATALSDVEIITIQVVGEALSLNDDKKIWRYFKENMQFRSGGSGCRCRGLGHARRRRRDRRQRGCEG